MLHGDPPARGRWDRDPLFRAQLALIALATLLILFLAWRRHEGKEGWTTGGGGLGGAGAIVSRGAPTPATARPVEPKARRLTLKGLLRILKDNASPEAARRALAILEAEPALAEAAAGGEVEEPLDDFLDRVAADGAREAALERALEKLTLDPGLQGALARAAQEPGVARVLGRLAAPVSGAGAAGSMPLARSAASAGGHSISGRGASAAGSRRAALPRGASSRAPSLGPKSGRADDEHQTGPAGGPPQAQQAPGAGLIEAQRLMGIQYAGPSKDMAQFIKSSFETMKPEDRSKLMDQCFTKGECDITVACATAGLVKECNDACRASPNCNGKITFTAEAAAKAKAAANPTTVQWGGGTRCCGEGQTLVSCVDAGKGRNHGVSVSGNCCTAFEGRRNYGGPGGLLTCR